MKIYEDKDTFEVVIIDGVRIDGFIDKQTCSKCNENIVYYDKYDSYFCPQCNEWIDSRCSDATCIYCCNKPDKPL